MSDSVFSLEINEQGIGIITMDIPGESQNVLKKEFKQDIQTILDDVEDNKAVKGLVIISGKPDSFIAGADISMLNAVTTAEEAKDISRTGQEMFANIEKLKIPVVAAINGPCLGGGLELAMACHARICSDAANTALGLPEVQLGLLPGSGGTQRLPKLVGIQTALDMMLTGKQLRARQALKAGLVDEVVVVNVLQEAAVKKALELAKQKPDRDVPFWKNLTSIKGIQKVVLEDIPQGRKVLFDQATKRTLAKTHGNYPAPEAILKCVETGVNDGPEAGYQMEAHLFGELVVSPQAQQLMNIFFASNDLKKHTGIDSDVEAAAINKVGVLGGGLMGAGIAFVTVDKAKTPVRVKDRDDNGIGHALGYSWKLWNRRVQKRYMTSAEMGKRQAMLTGCTDYSGFHNVDLVIEAVFEDLELKQQMIRDIEEHCHDKTIFATNTSSIPLKQIAEGAKRPGQVIGMHYFSPVDKMPLLEIIVTDETEDWVIASCVAFGKKQGKTVIVVNDGAGFYVNRILAPYMNEAGYLVAEGVPVDVLDKTQVKSGFPVGPMTLLDEVGIDVATKVSPILSDAFGERMVPPAMFSKLIDDNRLGRKNGRGFYKYDDDDKKSDKKEVDESVYRVLGVSPSSGSSSNEFANISERCLLMMVNEAVRCLEDGIIRSPRDGDIGAIFGIGFPPFLGGPFRFIDSQGSANIVERLEHYRKLHGDRFEPAPLLIEKAKSDGSFY